MSFGKPDEKIEEFWLTFKSSIDQFLDKKEREEIKQLSEKLNLLQKEERYEEIEEYIKNHIERIGYNIMKRDNLYRAGHLDTNIRRWENISKSRICSDNNIFYNLFRTYISLNKNRSDQKDKIRSLLVSYVKNGKQEDLVEIINLSIENNFVGTIDKFRNIIDISKFLKGDSHIDLNLCKSKRLIKSLQRIDVDTNIFKA